LIMPRKLRLVYFAHSLSSDWNNGNAHFLRGLMRALGQMGHDVTVFEPEADWSIDNLRLEQNGEKSLKGFSEAYPDISIQRYSANDTDYIRGARLAGVEFVILHEWNPPTLARTLLKLRDQLHFKLLFHDTHHRASSSPEQIESFGLRNFDGVLAFGDALRTIYRERFDIQQVWTLHEAADTTEFKPQPDTARSDEIVWVGNWGEGERSEELRRFLLEPADALRDVASTTVFGVRYPEHALFELQRAGIAYGGYLPNLDAASMYAKARATLHVPRQQYSKALRGIPTIRVFEALACRIPLVSAPWEDSEQLFRTGDFLWATNTAEMTDALRLLLTDRGAAEDIAGHGMETLLARHTCMHRAHELTAICEELLSA
jgi:spore maturation protein CgeB